MRCTWKIQESDNQTVQILSERLGTSLLVARCLANRGITDEEHARHFLDPLLRNLSDPFLLPDMTCAVENLLNAHASGDGITIFGDYDVDGVTATAILTEFFSKLGWNYLGSYLPLRMEEGYGLTEEGVHHCLELYPNTKLLIAVDCGSTCAKTIASLMEQGVKVIVLDHHQIDDSDLPIPLAFVNPQRLTPNENITEEFIHNLQGLCSAGLAFKLAHAILRRARTLGLPWGMNFDLKDVLDLVALGTIADLVRLRGENRIFVDHGLRHIQQTKRHGLRELISVSHRNPDALSVYDVSFYLAPRLNAAGRIEDAQDALQLLTTEDPWKAQNLAHQLERMNQERKGLQNRIVQEVTDRVLRNFDPDRDYVIVEGSFEWHLGVVGIAAAQIARQFNRPVIILGGNGQNWHGSCRSIEGFDMAAALRECEELLLNHGGHSMAAGVDVELNKLEPFRKKINEVARLKFTRDVPKPTLRLDSEVTIADLSTDNLRNLLGLAPFGMENPPLAFVSRNPQHHLMP